MRIRLPFKAINRMPYHIICLVGFMISGLFIHTTESWNGLFIRDIPLMLILLITFVLAAVNKEKDILNLRGSKDRFTWAIIILLLYEVGVSILQIIGILLTQDGDITGISVVCILLAVLVLKKNIYLNDTILRILMIGGGIVSLICILDSIVDGDTIFDYWYMIRIEDDIASAVIILYLIVTTYSYLFCEIDKIRKLYLIAVCIGMFALNLQECYMGRLIAFFILGAFPFFYIPTARLLRRICVVLCIYLAICSNIGIITDYNSMFAMSASYPIDTTIVIDIFLIMMFAIFDYYWKKIPAEVNPAGLVYKRLYKVYSMIYGFILATMIGIMLNGQRIVNMEWTWWNDNFIQLLDPIISELIDDGEAGLYILLANHDIITSIGALILIWTVMIKLWRNKSYAYSYKTLGLIIFISYIIIGCLLEIDSQSSILYLLVPIYSLYGHEEAKEYTLRKRKAKD